MKQALKSFEKQLTIKEQILSVIQPGEELQSAEIGNRVRHQYGSRGCGNITGYLTNLFREGNLSRYGFKNFLYKLKERNDE